MCSAIRNVYNDNDIKMCVLNIYFSRTTPSINNIIYIFILHIFLKWKYENSYSRQIRQYVKYRDVMYRVVYHGDPWERSKTLGF